MEPIKMTYEVKKGKQRDSVEISKVENGFTINHYPHMGPSKYYVALTHEAAKKLAKKCLGEDAKEVDDEKEPSNVLKGVSIPYENKY